MVSDGTVRFGTSCPGVWAVACFRRDANEPKHSIRMDQKFPQRHDCFSRRLSCTLCSCRRQEVCLQHIQRMSPLSCGRPSPARVALTLSKSRSGMVKHDSELARFVDRLLRILLPDRNLILCVPCVVCGVLWSWVSRKYQHFAVLPMTMLAVPAVFFIGLALSGEDIQVNHAVNCFPIL